MFSHLRVMDEEDLDWVVQVEKAVQLSPWSRVGFERAIKQGLNFLFCNVEDQPMGYVCMLPVADELHLLNLSVDVRYQRQGVANKGLVALFQRFENTHYAVVLLEVRKSNRSAQALYQKMGFAQDGIRKNYYVVDERTREDAILMSKPLK